MDDNRPGGGIRLRPWGTGRPPGSFWLKFISEGGGGGYKRRGHLKSRGNRCEAGRFHGKVFRFRLSSLFEKHRLR